MHELIVYQNKANWWYYAIKSKQSDFLLFTLSSVDVSLLNVFEITEILPPYSELQLQVKTIYFFSF